MVLPSPTMIVHRQIKAATQKRKPILLTGHQMGGGPSAWAAEAHARAGFQVYATPEAAKTLNDELEKVRESGIRVVSEEEAARLLGLSSAPAALDLLFRRVLRLELPG
jgi:uncharacterized protein (DUF1786 family)